MLLFINNERSILPKILEKKLDSKHKKVKYGVTDITTENEHIEIKKWSDYKHALGQLCSYNQCDKKKVIGLFFWRYV